MSMRSIAQIDQSINQSVTQQRQLCGIRGSEGGSGAVRPPGGLREDLHEPWGLGRVKTMPPIPAGLTSMMTSATFVIGCFDRNLYEAVIGPASSKAPNGKLEVQAVNQLAMSVSSVWYLEVEKEAKKEAK
jgi:hypothetical protein